AGAEERVLFLDYDGTLVPYANRPEKVKPSRSLLKMLKRLTSSPKNRIYLMSGRSPHDLERWFSGVSRLGLGAEHGMFFRDLEDQEWRTIQAIPTRWKSVVRPILQSYVRRTPGSF